jgi:glutamate carboxypeptidase
MLHTIPAYLQSRLTDYTADLTTLAGMDSYSYDKDDVNRVVDWLESRLKHNGFSVERFANADAGDDLLAVRRGRGSGRVLLLGHSDTVFPRGTAAARPVTRQGDKLLGPGTADMKAGLLAGIYAVEALDHVSVDDYEQIAFLIVSDEEIDERHAVPLIRRSAHLGDAVLTLEAARANGDIVTARKGVRAFVAEAFGKAAHSGVEPEKGRSAILAMARMIDALEAINDPAREITVNVGFIEGGRQRNVVPDYARIIFEARAYTPELLTEAEAQVRTIFARTPVPDVRFALKVEQDSLPPMPRTESVARLEGLAVEIASTLGFSVKGAKTGGASDGAICAGEGVPVLDGLGPIGGLDHSPDEYILASSIVPRTALLALLIARITHHI